MLISDNRMFTINVGTVPNVMPKSKAWDILLVLTSVAGNLCNKCPSGYSNKTAVKVILSMRSLVSIEQQSPRRPCDNTNPRVGGRCAKPVVTCIIFAETA